MRWGMRPMELTLTSVFPERLEREDPLEHATEFDRFLREVEARAFRIAVVTIRDPDEALDVVQDAMIRLANAYRRRPRDEWRPLFYRILQNRVRDWHRRRAVRTRILGFFTGADEEGNDPLAAAPAPSHENPLERVAAEETLAALGVALRRLPERQREAFVLRNFEGLDVAETALAMGCSQGSVKTHHSRAVARLRELLGEHWEHSA
jgi:RNA polymerase sigma-70 factor, ECF subfamily